MKIVALVASLLATSAVQAADLMPVKALPRPSVLVSYNGSGFYAGLGTFAENDKISTGGAGLLNLGGTYQVGAALSGVVGYMRGDGTRWQAVEAMGSYKNVGMDTIVGPGMPAAFSSRYGFTERLLVGTDIQSLLQYLPSLGGIFPALPVAVGSNAHPYIFGAIHEDPLRTNIGLQGGKAWIIKGGFGVGVMTQLNNRFVLDTWAEYLPAGGSMTVGLPIGVVAQASEGRGSRIGATLKW